MNKYVIVAIIAVLAFAGGLYLGRQQNSTQTTNTKVKETTRRQTVIVKEKDGREVTTINERIDSVERVTEKKVGGVKRKTVNVSLLVGVQDGKLLAPAYGLSVSKELLGPITVTAFGLNNGILGVGIGVNF